MTFRTPEPFKKSQYIFGKYRARELALLILGGVFSAILIIAIITIDFTTSLLFKVGLISVSLLPTLFGMLLTLPVHGYFNFKVFSGVLIKYLLRTKRKYIWAGHIMNDGEQTCSQEDKK